MTPGPALGAQAHVPVRTNRYAFAMATEAAPQTVESRLHAPEVTIVLGGPGVGLSPGMAPNPELANKPEVVQELVKIVRQWRK